MKKLEYDSGVYLLEMLLEDELKLEIGKLGEFDLPPGYYYYVGTAQQNLRARVDRHLRTEKTLRWHIDYLLQHARVLQVYTWSGEREMECLLQKRLQDFPAAHFPIAKFGASDCKCESHLVYFNYRPNIKNLLHVVKLQTGLQGDELCE